MSATRKHLLSLRQNQCEVCHYKKTTRALCFVRIYGVSENNPSKELSKLSLETAIKRLKNFAVLCGNCFAELQDNLLEIEKIDPIKKIYRIRDISHLTPAEIVTNPKREKSIPANLTIDV